MTKKALLLVNLGTPDRADKKAVFRYLTEFLNDRRVIDIPLVLQKMLVNLIIIPFRLAKSTKLYQKLWTDKGSPLLIYLESLISKMQLKLRDDYEVYGAMRYGNPSLKSVLLNIKEKQFDEVIIFPLFPQYASSTTGSLYQKIGEITNGWDKIPSWRFISQYYNHPAFIKAFTQRIKSYDLSAFDHIVFTYHGLPVRHAEKVHPAQSYASCTCSEAMPAHGLYCYNATSYETTRLLAASLQLQPSQYSMGFQSRLSKNWLKPFTDEIIVSLAQKGHKKMLIVAPSFTADCLETVIELGDEYRELFLHHGGEDLQLVSSLNDEDLWVEGIAAILHDKG